MPNGVDYSLSGVAYRLNATHKTEGDLRIIEVAADSVMPQGLNIMGELAGRYGFKSGESMPLTIDSQGMGSIFHSRPFSLRRLSYVEGGQLATIPAIPFESSPPETTGHRFVGEDVDFYERGASMEQYLTEIQRQTPTFTTALEGGCLFQFRLVFGGEASIGPTKTQIRENTQLYFGVVDANSKASMWQFMATSEPLGRTYQHVGTTDRSLPGFACSSLEPSKSSYSAADAWMRFRLTPAGKGAFAFAWAAMTDGPEYVTSQTQAEYGIGLHAGTGGVVSKPYQVVLSAENGAFHTATIHPLDLAALDR